MDARKRAYGRVRESTDVTARRLRQFQNRPSSGPRGRRKGKIQVFSSKNQAAGKAPRLQFL